MNKAIEFARIIKVPWIFSPCLFIWSRLRGHSIASELITSYRARPRNFRGMLPTNVVIIYQINVGTKQSVTHLPETKVGIHCPQR